MYKMRRMGKRVQADPKFKTDLKRDLLLRIHEPSLFTRLMAPVAAVLTVAVSLGAGTGVYAYTSDAVLPDSALYGLREGIEAAEEFVQSAAPTRLAQVRRKHLERRIREVELMKDRKKEISERHIERVTTSFERAIAAGDNIPERVRERHDEILAIMELQQAKFIQNLQEDEAYTHKREQIEKILRDESERLGDRVEKMDVKRQERYQNIRKRHEAIRNKLRFRLKNGSVEILNSTDSSATNTDSDTDPAIR